MPQLARWLTFIDEFDYEIVHRNGKRHANADGLGRKARSLAARHEGAVEFASQSTNSELLNAACYTDTEPDKVMDSKQSKFKEQIPSAKLVHAPDKEPAKTEAKPSVRESLAACKQSDPELGKLVRLRLQSAEQPALALLSTESESAKKLYNQWKRLDYKKGSYDEELKKSLVNSLIRSYSFPDSQYKTCSTDVTKNDRRPLWHKTYARPSQATILLAHLKGRHNSFL